MALTPPYTPTLQALLQRIDIDPPGSKTLSRLRLSLYGAVSAPLTVIGLPLAIYIPPLYGEMGWI